MSYPAESEASEPASIAGPPVLPVEGPVSLDQVATALHQVAPLSGLSEEEYRWLAAHGTQRFARQGDLIFLESERASALTFILQGDIQVRRRKAGPMALFIGRAGQMTGKLPFSRMKNFGGDGFCSNDTWVLDIDEACFTAMLAAIPSMAQRCVSVLLDRVREVTRMEQQAEKLSALGKLAANLAHELNNPASAAQRSAAALRSELRTYGDRKYKLGSACLNPETSQRLQNWVVRTREQFPLDPVSAGASDLPLDGIDREAAVLAWLEQHGVQDAWTIAPEFAESRMPLSELEEFAAEFPDGILAPALSVYASSLRVERMATTIAASTDRIFDLISAIKDYSYMDQAPIQEVDLAQSLETTLAMFGSRLAKIALETDFDPNLPVIHAYGSELNQVWTALIENALDAMPDGGTLSLRTRLSGQMALVEVWDSGTGIAPELKNRIFEPFFTTKSVGSGLGLGLDTVQRVVSKHSGFVRVESKPGETCFQVRLPIDPAEAY